ncbi:extracellular solute-binding protein [Cohnella herbarum]|uniref:Extracellular solute-binding protein n=1 Tax=Cohnella herbarum TaxID=2728023 RepID=A0A7Z2ZN15_9BACL|nr:extracellular solute-binding protein [Cohnella herbarum]QJD85911.1 extracellular solute-binding protein [Cohnella herbarum]
MKKSLLSLLAFAVVLSGCSSASNNNNASPTSSQSPSSSSTAPGKTTTLKILTHWDAANSQAYLDKVKAYEAVNPNVKIELQNVPFGELLKKITVSNISGEGADIYHIYSAWLPELTNSKSIAPAEGTFLADIQAGYGQNIQDSVSSGGAIYGYPTELTTYALNYNKRLFAEAGITAPPKTWDELLDYAKRLTKIEGGQVVQQGFGVITGWDSGTVHPFLTLLNSNGGNFIAADGKSTELDNPQALQTFELYKKLIDDKSTNREMSPANASTTGAYMNNFELEKTAMIIMANWWKSSLQSTMGDKYQNVGTAPIPVGPSGTDSVSVFYSWLYSVSSHSKNQEEAWKFLQWVNSPAAEGQSSIQGDWLLTQGIIPSRTSDQEAHKAELGDDFMKTYVELLQKAKPFPIVKGASEITTALQKKIEGVVFGATSPADAAKGAVSEINDILGR